MNLKIKISFVLLILLVANFDVFCKNDSLLVHDIRKNTINLCDNKTGILVFASGLACKDCFKELNTAILALHRDKHFDNIGVLVKNIKKDEVKRGYVLTIPVILKFLKVLKQKFMY